MHLFYIRLIVLIVIVGSNAHFSKQAIAFAATPARNHILLLDSSGSMKSQYEDAIRKQLIIPLIDRKQVKWLLLLSYLPITTQITTQNPTFEIQILIKIKQFAKPYLFLFLIEGLAITILFSSIVVLCSQKSFQLSGLEKEKILKIRTITTIPLVLGDELVGTLSWRFDSLRVEVFPPYVLENGIQQQEFSIQSGIFVLINTKSHKFWECSIKPLSQSTKSYLNKDNNNPFIS